MHGDFLSRLNAIHILFLMQTFYIYNIYIYICRYGAVSPPLDHEVTLSQEPDSDWGEDIGQEEEDSAGEDSVSHLSHNSRKVVFGVSNQVHHRPACTLTEER